ncbi:MAG: threonine dehydratase [Gemmatimonadaceae bacterium]|nr:threonine dehydratase [Gloeobacterales cyanobacterium ES-bin-141]
MATKVPYLFRLEEAARLVHTVMPPTPQYCWPLLCHRVGTEVWVKHENHTPIGAFKVRGGLVLMDYLRRSKPGVAGIVSATRGNHGQSLAFAARRHGLKTVIVVPHGNSVEKNAAMQALGAELIEYGDDFQAATEHAQRLALERDWFRVPSFHPLLVEGVATGALELLRTVTDLDTVYVPIGMGSGICAMVAVRDALGLRMRIVGVVSSGAPAYARSFVAGRPVSHPVTTLVADGLACRQPDPDALEVIRRGVERIVEVSDAEIEEAMRAFFYDTHNVAEGAGAAGLAALLQESSKMAGRKVGLVLCGGNVDSGVFARILAAHG